MRRPFRLDSERGLDWLNFFVANLQTAFGPFIAVYLTSRHWTQGEIGFALTVGTVTAMVSQVPAGAAVDAVANKRLAAFAAILAIVASCLLLALFPQRLPVLLAEVLHGFASCMLQPAIAAITLGMVAIRISAGAQPGELGRRLGRNASFGSMGNALAAGLMGGAGYIFSASATFYLGALLALPGLLALRAIEQPRAPLPDTAAVADPGDEPEEAAAPRRGIRDLLRDRRLFAFAICTMLFHLANAAMLPLAAGEITKEAGQEAELIIAACILGPQIIVALLSPHVGRLAETVGRRPVMLLGFAALPLRGLLLATSDNPYLTVLFQLFDGVSAATFGVMLPLIAADLTRGTGRFNLCIGFFGLAVGVGASLSTTLAGLVADRSLALSFIMLAGAGLLCVIMVWLLFGDTTPRHGPRRWPRLRLRRAHVPGRERAPVSQREET